MTSFEQQNRLLRFALVVTVCVIVLLAIELSRTRSKLDDVTSELARVDASVSELGDSLDQADSTLQTLESDVSDFDSENWRDVVPEVESATSDVRSQVDDARSNLEGTQAAVRAAMDAAE